MPQLNPNPWFLILTTTWLSLVLFFLTKLLLATPTLPLPHHHNILSIPNWIWSWT